MIDSNELDLMFRGCLFDTLSQLVKLAKFLCNTNQIECRRNQIATDLNS